MDPSAEPRSDGPPKRRRLSIIDVATIAILASLVATVAVIQLDRRGQEMRASEVEATLMRAALAAEKYGDFSDGSFAGLNGTGEGTLQKFGFRPVGEVVVEILDAQEDSYCIRAAHSQKHDSKWNTATIESAERTPRAADTCQPNRSS